MELTIEINDDGFVINGESFFEGLEIAKLKSILGEPRVQKKEPDKNYREYMERRRGKEYFENFKTLVWDDAGIYSHTEDGKTLLSIGIVFDNSRKTAEHTPKSNFSGVFTINGGDWLTAVKAGRDMFENYCKLNVKKYVIFAEYKNSKMTLPDRGTEDFTLIEITCAY